MCTDKVDTMPWSSTTPLTNGESTHLSTIILVFPQKKGKKEKEGRKLPGEEK